MTSFFIAPFKPSDWQTAKSDLKIFDRLDWMGSDAGLESLADGLDRYRIRPLITGEMAADLAPMDERSLRAGMLGTDPDGLYKVQEL